MSDDRQLIHSSNDLLLSNIATAASNEHVDAAKMRELWNIKREIDERSQREEFQRAMRSVQEEIQPIVRSSKGNNSRYAKLEAIDRAVRPIYTSYGFSLTFGGRTDVAGSLTITCECMHRSGHTQHYELPGTLDSSNKAKSDIQALGSTVTYLRRYLTCLIFNIVFEDPDDNDGVVGVISHEQVLKIVDILHECMVKEATFAEYMGVSRIDEIPARDYARAMAALQAKQRKLAQEK